MLAGHLTAGPAFGGADGEAITTAAALHHGLTELGWDAAVTGPGPGILGSGSALGHGGLQALDSAHTALALGCETLLVARMSSTDRRERHRGISHHTRTVLELLLAPVVVALPDGGAAGRRAPRLARVGGRPRRLRGERTAAALDGERRTRCSSPPRLRRARPWRRCDEPTTRRSSRSAARPSSRAASSPCASSAFATPTARRSSARSCAARTPPRSSPTTPSTSGSCASRARRSSSTRSSCPPASSTSTGETPLQTAQRELAEEIGREAEHWSTCGRTTPSSGYTDELVHIFAATGLRAVRRRARPRRADRDRALAARRARRRARGDERRQDGHRPAVAARDAGVGARCVASE